MNKNRSIWQHPWQYTEGFIIATGFFLIGVFLEIITAGKGVILPSFPTNIFILVFLVVVLIAMHAFRKSSHLVQWLGSVPAALAAIVATTTLVLLMGFIPQNDSVGGLLPKLGFTHLFKSWQYTLLAVFLTITLGLTTLKRLTPFNFKAFGFFLNHAGLWLVLTSASLGAGDLQRVTLQTQIGRPVWFGENNQGKMVELPIALELKQFKIDEYLPEIVVVNKHSGEIVYKQKHPRIVKAGFSFKVAENEFLIEKYIESAVLFGMEYRPYLDTGSAPTAFIKCLNNAKLSGWVSSGSFRQDPRFVEINNELLLAMTVPTPKKYHSDIIYYTKEQKTGSIYLEVNKPVKIGEWELYQTGFNEKMGRWSNVSIVEAVKDPWLNVVYVGIFMLLAGSIFLFWQGKNRKLNAGSVNNENTGMQ